MSRRKEHVQVLVPGSAQPQQAEVELLVCNRCGAKVVPQAAPALAWVSVKSDGRGGLHLDFCGPEHAADYFRELMPPTPAGERRPGEIEHLEHLTPSAPTQHRNGHRE